MDILNGDFDPKKFRKEFYSLYNIYEYKRMNGLDYFYYLTNIIHDKKFYVTLGILNKNTYRDLCISLLHFVENNYLEFIDDIIICMCNKEKIIKNLICNIRSVKYMDIEIENESERIMICALFYYNRKKYTKALLLYNKLYNNEKTNIELCIMLAKTMHKIGLDDEAILLIRESIIINGRNDKLLSCISVILFEKKLYSESKKYLLALIKMRNNVNDYIYYARSLKEENRINDAINFLKNNITKFPENNPFMSHLGAYLIMDNQLYEGLLILNKVKETKNYPIWVDDWINKAQKLIIKNEHSLLAKLKEKNL